MEDLRGIHVLVVEDDDDSREALRLVMEYCGAFVMAAASAEEAKRRLRIFRPHVLVTDIGMPGDGLALFREVKAMCSETGVRVPAIAITAYQRRRDELMDEGFVEVFEKPFDPMELCGAVRRHA